MTDLPPPESLEGRRLSPTELSDPDLGRRNGAWLRGWARPARGALAAAVACGALGGLLLIVQAFLLAAAIHLVVVMQRGPEALWPLLAVLLLVIALRALLHWAGERAGARAATLVKQRLRRAVFEAMLLRGPGWIREHRSGALASALIEQIEAFDGYFARYLPAMALAVFLPAAMVVAILPREPVVALLLLATLPLIPLFMALVGMGAAASSRRQLKALTRMGGHFVERLRGLATLKLYGRAEAELEEVRRVTDGVRSRTLAVLRIAFLSSAVLEFFAALAVAGVALYLGLSYLGLLTLRTAPLSLEVGLFCLLLAPDVYLPLRNLATHYHDRASALAAAEELRTLLESDLPQAPARHPTAPLAAAQPGRPLPQAEAIGLSLDDVTLRLGAGERIALDGVSFSVAPGEILALAGPSGSGKTTVLEVILGLRQPQQGSVLWNGVPLADLDPASLRARLAYMSQRPHLFHGTLAQNLRLFNPDASDAQVEAAARAAGVLDFAAELPQGLDTPLGERGFGLSGGQAQRLALARVFLRQAPLLLLDEPTAHLDRATEAALLERLASHARGRTLVIATHSPAVIAMASRVLHLAEGRIVAEEQR